MTRRDARPDPPAALWAAAVNRLLARVLLAVIGCLLAMTLLPRAAGMDPYVITSGSMRPQVNPGDLVIAAPVDPASLRAGQVIVFTDPDVPSRTLTHRVVARRPDGSLTTRGDNNGTADSAPVPPGNVRGLARLRVPAIGLPVYWSTGGQRTPLVLTGLTVAGLLALALRRLPGDGPAGAAAERPAGSAGRPAGGRHRRGRRAAAA